MPVYKQKIVFRTNGVNNPNQTVLDLVAGSNITLTVMQEEVIISASGGGGGTTATFVDDETPTGVIDSANTSFAVATAPDPQDSLELYLNGLFQDYGVDYTLAGTAITYASPPQTGDVLVAYYRLATAGPAATFVDDETPMGTINGINDTFMLVNAPNPGNSLKLYLNGLLQDYGVDYTLAGSTITFAAPPQTGDILLCNYRF